ncbi:MAG: carbohydrate kinase family protein [Candidatus Saccharibacteria bacterium]|nr:carbohydrate kinase family protein [Candidatus Saccharibacteria bacterium]
MNKQLSFLCVGSSSQDVYLHNMDGLAPVCANPEDCFYNVHLGDKIYVNKVDFMTGGGASNASVTFARGGQKSYFMGLIGCDPAGSACLASFASDNVDTKYVSYTRRYNTDYSTLLLAPNGERTILTYRGCGAHIKPKHFDLTKVDAQIDWMYMTSMVGHFDIYEPLVKLAHERGVKIAWNPGKAELDQPDKVKALLPYIEILSVNKQEAQKLVAGDTLEELLRQLRQYCPVVLITDGTNGSIAADRSEVIRAGLYHADEKSVDRTGAGDSFCSGFTLKYAVGAGLKEAVYFASANSASVVMHIGAKPGILRADAEPPRDPMDIHNIEL